MLSEFQLCLTKRSHNDTYSPASAKRHLPQPGRGKAEGAWPSVPQSSFSSTRREPTSHPNPVKNTNSNTQQRFLVAADVDKTILTQHHDEEKTFFGDVGPSLAAAAQLGAEIALVTGNSILELTDRVLRLLLAELVHRDMVHLLPNFHFFTNSGGVYIHFPDDDRELTRAFRKKHRNKDEKFEELYSAITVPMERERRGIHPRFLNPHYITQE